MLEPVLIPPPAPSFTLSPALGLLPDEEFASVERCVASLSGKLAGVIVTDVRTRRRHRIVVLETALGPMVISERIESTTDIRAAA